VDGSVHDVWVSIIIETEQDYPTRPRLIGSVHDMQLETGLVSRRLTGDLPPGGQGCRWGGYVPYPNTGYRLGLVEAPITISFTYLTRFNGQSCSIVSILQ
jgi:hypothetical protein